jgi:hypothetical protein
MEYRPGDLRPTGKGHQVEVVAPAHCRNGHPLGPNQVLVGTELCDAGGTGRYRRHVTWTCRTCGDEIIGNGHPKSCG